MECIVQQFHNSMCVSISFHDCSSIIICIKFPSTSANRPRSPRIRVCTLVVLNQSVFRCCFVHDTPIARRISVYRWHVLSPVGQSVTCVLRVPYARNQPSYFFGGSIDFRSELLKFWCMMQILISLSFSLQTFCVSFILWRLLKILNRLLYRCIEIWRIEISVEARRIR